ncbi:alpha-1,3-mannosyl-glycoprotein 4-beta-N-acetylglucosaminyltransferase C-like isoform X1 [Mytilus galloprovincialis]|uniref:alpha-1,3-mannosyl-glycoprotein 4-beta-N-acetylglucosaminyltransferase C-like isoform X1 n=2 Tax=Mytilus galloprovincialis TaxID=29158 RepID=UPI003F7BAD76
MRKTRKVCCKLLLCTVCLICIFHILLTVDVNMTKRNDEILHYQQAGMLMNNISLFRNILAGKEMKNLSLPSPLTEFQKFYNNHNAVDKKVVMYGQSTRDQGWFNRTYLQLMKKKISGTELKNLTLPSALVDFERFYNTHSNIDNSVVQYGNFTNRQGYLTIGIPTVKRRLNGDHYMYTTLNSLISNTDQGRIQDVIIVIFMADPDESWNNESAKKIYEEFKPHFDSGFMQIIKAPENIYPDFSNLQKTKQDSAERVQWRSKQNVDFAFLMLYCQNLSTYYIQLEDDVLVASNFVKDIESFVLNRTDHWICLEFSTLGFIGKMFHSSDLRVISSVLLTYFSETPCDLLLGGIIKFLGQNTPIHSSVSLFQHIGKISSLRNKMMPSIDRFFKDKGSNILPIMKLPKGGHPDAKFETNMKIIPDYPPENVYKNNLFFWASYPRSKQYFRLIFTTNINMSRLVISTGENINKTDFLENGVLKVGFNNKQHICNDLKEIGRFVEGEFDSLIQGIVIPENIKCLHIEAKKGQKRWLIIREIEIFQNKKYEK